MKFWSGRSCFHCVLWLLLCKPLPNAALETTVIFYNSSQALRLGFGWYMMSSVILWGWMMWAGLCFVGSSSSSFFSDTNKQSSVCPPHDNSRRVRVSKLDLLSLFHTSTYITYPSISVAKASYLAKPRVRKLYILPSLVGWCKVQGKGERNKLGSSCNLLLSLS